MKTLHRYIYLVLLILLVSLVGCSAPVIPTLSTASTRTSSAATPLPTSALSPTSIPQLSTNTPTPTPIPPTYTPRATPTPSPTPISTMTADEEYALVSEMLQDNGNCRLPCWWGFTPGKTSPQAVEIFFTSQGKKVWDYSDSQDYMIIFDIPAHYSHGQNYVVREDIIEMIGIGASPLVGEDGYFAYGDPKFIEDWKPYMLPQILEVYGRPQQVFLETYNHMLWIPFRLLLFYPDQGFLVKYEGDIGEEGRHHGPIESGKVIRICPWRSEIYLLLWPPEHEMTFDDLGPDIRNPVENYDKWRSLEEATGMSIEQFYQTFVQPDNQTYLETPADMW